MTFSGRVLLSALVCLAALEVRAQPSPRPGVEPPVTAEALPGEQEFNACVRVPGNRSFKINLKPDAEVSDLLQWLSTITCTSFIVPSTVSLSGKKVTVMAPEPITRTDAYRLFYLALESVGLTVEPNGKVLRIIESNRAKTSNMPLYRPDQATPRDKRFVTKLIRVEHLDANELHHHVLQRLKTESGDIIPYRAKVIITDTAESVRRLEQIIREFNVPSANPRERIWLVPIKNMSATAMAERLAEVIPVRELRMGRQGTPAGGPAPAPAAPAAGRAQAPQWPLPGDLSAEMAITRMVPEERSNSLIIVANQRAYEWVATLIGILDRPIGSDGDGKVHLYHCEHANCDELAATLSAVAGVEVSGGARAPARRTSQGPQAPVPLPTPLPSLAGPAGQGAPGLLFEGQVRVTFDAATNSMLVVSSLKDFQSLRKVIEKLDRPRKQVFVEAAVLEVLLDKTREIGVAYHGGKPLGFPGNDSSLLLGGFEAQRTLNPAGLISSLGGLTGALFGPTIPAQNVDVFGTAVQLPSFGVFLQLLQTNNDVNVLSTPHLLITNNQEGEISVGENLPFPGQLFGGIPGLGQEGLGGFLPTVGVQRQDVALKMKITPSVNEHDVIRMEVEQEISDVSAPNFNNLGPATSTRKARTSVVTRDQQTVVIGGLMSDRTSEVRRKVPILGDIPVIGFFFRSSTKAVKKTNIIIALTPYVISDLSDLRRLADRKLKERRMFLERYSSLEDHVAPETGIDYRSKRGMVEEINRTAREVELEESELQRLRERHGLDTAFELVPSKAPLPPTTPQPPSEPAGPPPGP